MSHGRWPGEMKWAALNDAELWDWLVKQRLPGTLKPKPV
jgi:predicted peptidase